MDLELCEKVNEILRERWNDMMDDNSKVLKLEFKSHSRHFICIRDTK